MKYLTLKNVYDSGEFSARLYNALRYTVVTKSDPTGESFTIGELIQLIEDKGISYLKQISRNMGAKSVRELNEWLIENTGVDYIKYEFGSTPSPIDSMKGEALKLMKLLMMESSDSIMIKRRVEMLSKLSSQL